MLFNSFEFAIFLPIVFILYWFVFHKNVKLQNSFILVASYVFYGWWDWRFLVLIAFTSFCSWLSGILIEKCRENTKKAKTISVLNIVLNLLILGVFKYYDFFATSFAEVFLHGKTNGLLLNIILPVGISFYTFQALSYSIDVYRGTVKPTKDIVRFFAFLSFFPQLVAGPIERASNLLPQFEKPREFDYDKAMSGVRLILWGLFKKIVVADNCAVFVNQVFSMYQTQTGSMLMLAAILFTFQIYGDFSGYSDIAIGTGRLFGINLMRNFNVPYFSRDIAEFWRRWHISLTRWFRDYVYIPLGGSRCSKGKVIRNTFVIFILSGLWHGANWTFVVWGLYHALLFLPLIILGKNRKHTDVVAINRRLPTFGEFGQIVLTFLLALIGWIIFRADNIDQAWNYICGMLQWGTLKAFYRFFLCSKSLVWPVNLYIILMIIVEWRFRRCDEDLVFQKISFPKRFALLFMLCLVIFVGMQRAGGEFIYFQF